MLFHVLSLEANRSPCSLMQKSPRNGCLILMAAILLSGNGSPAKADALAQDILKKMSAVYDVKSFQGTVTVNQTGTTEENKPFNVSSVEEITFKRPNLYLIKNSGPGVGGTQISVFDGKETVNYTSTRNIYKKSSASLGPSGNANVSVFSLLGVRFDVQSGSMMNATTVGGKAAYVVRVIPPVPALPLNASGVARTQQEQLKKMLTPYELAIDKKDYHLLRITLIMPSIKLTKTLELTRQTLNPNIADNFFTFSPPPGANLLTQNRTSMQEIMAAGAVGKPGRQGARISRGSGSPVPPPHASPGATGTTKNP